MQGSYLSEESAWKAWIAWWGSPRGACPSLHPNCISEQAPHSALSTSLELLSDARLVLPSHSQRGVPCTDCPLYSSASPPSPPCTLQVSATTWELLAESEEWLATGGVEIKGKGKMETFFWQPPADFLGDASMDPPLELASDPDPTIADPDPLALTQLSADMNVGRIWDWAVVMRQAGGAHNCCDLPALLGLRFPSAISAVCYGGQSPHPLQLLGSDFFPPFVAGKHA